MGAEPRYARFSLSFSPRQNKRPRSFATIHLHALSAAIPHSILILHALLDILPFPKRCVTYELKSGSVKCFDEKKSLGGGVVKQKKRAEVGEEQGGWEWEPVLFDDEEDEREGQAQGGVGKGKGKAEEVTDGTMWQEKGDVRVRIVVSRLGMSTPHMGTSS